MIRVQDYGFAQGNVHSHFAYYYFGVAVNGRKFGPSPGNPGATVEAGFLAGVGTTLLGSNLGIREVVVYSDVSADRFTEPLPSQVVVGRTKHVHVFPAASVDWKIWRS